MRSVIANTHSSYCSLAANEQTGNCHWKLELELGLSDRPDGADEADGAKTETEADAPSQWNATVVAGMSK